MSASHDLLANLGAELPLVRADATGRIVAASAAAATWLNVAESELIGRALDVEFPTVEPGIRAFRDPESKLRCRVRSLGACGGEGTLLLLEDVTALNDLRLECQQLARLAAAGRLVAGIVHEVNNPLSSIVGYAQLLLVRDCDPTLRPTLEKIHAEALRTTRIVRNLLDFVRKRPEARSRVRMAQVVKKAFELKAHDLQVHNVSVHVSIPSDLPEVAADPHVIVQVIVNLVTNAEQAMYGSDRGGRIDVRALAADDRVVLDIGDTGPGIPEEHRQSVFEPFFTTKGEGQGTGLGLALCRDLLSRCGATIRLVPSRSGALFRLDFPRHEGAENAEIPNRRNTVERVRGRRIVVVDDDPVVRAMISEAFEESGNRVWAFDRSDPALAFLRQHPVDAIFSDMHRPGLNGREFLDRLRAFDGRLAERVIFLTGDAMSDSVASSLRANGNLALTKPALLRDLHGAVNQLLARAAARQHLLFPADGQERRAGN